MKHCEISNLQFEILALKELYKQNPSNVLKHELDNLYNQLCNIQDFEEYKEHYIDPFELLLIKGKMTDKY
tara:strand:+ start:228 stop:437 length:210 start_codon:yes stop_codon:yes gene_type:complete